MLCQLWDRWRLQGSHAGHHKKIIKKKKKLFFFMSMYIRKMSFGSFSGFLSIQENICFSYRSLDFEFFFFVSFFFSFFVYDVIVLL